MAIKFGITPLTATLRGQSLQRTFEEACEEVKLAEEVGFDSVMLPEHHQIREGQFNNPLMLGAAIAARTKRIRIGTCVLLLPLYHPMHVAEDAAMLDIISGGRVILGLGLGYLDRDFATFGVPLSNRVSLFEEGLEIIRRAWTEEKFSFAGKRYQLNNVSLQPQPIQKPHPPIYMGAWTLEGVKRAGRVADGWILDPIQGLPAIKAMSAVYRDVAAKRERPANVILIREMWCAKSRAEAVAELGPHVMIHHRFYFKNKAYMEDFDPWVKDIKSPAELTLDRVADRMILGAPEECIDQIARWQEELGIEGMVFRMRHSSGPSHEKAMESIRLFGEKVIPHFT